ncbi:MAG TPA: iron-siderophore ABC transporter substrate-binding protein [Propioniciclava sp.]|uniref:iron-siderophore ABC transporter substrate-binding protein n=1 Tax=Propioniciclava sp. TaxID=2038686 RepID=UPI002C0485A4|nr:iron-siderophore ABC transporter substrate-binding protein [Propioniciclava sp.]HRL49263.1 iron-siderophore ABC transporter substrate-binding protein [Propioniciclava sp.]HRL79540.1 iron-siderophore ABC transporter substrate-binding protein [Propioniciclava sp.]
MRFPRAVLAAAAALVLALTGCASGAPSPSATGTPSSSAAGAFPATVDTAFGAVTVDKAPQRIVALGWGDAEVALALGAQPVGASDWLGFGGDGQGPWAQGLYTTAPTIIGTMEPSYEAIAALQPDLILDVRSSGDKDRYQRLSQITTTVGIPEGGESWLTSMEDQVDLISTVLGVPEKGKELLAKVDATYSDVAAAHPQWKGKTVAAAAKTSEGWGAYIKGGGRVETLERFGFVQSPTIAALPTDTSGFTVKISSENLDQLEADLIVAFPIYLETTAITDDPAWQRLAAVQQGRAVVIDGDVSNAFSASTPLASIYAVQQLTPLFEKALPA